MPRLPQPSTTSPGFLVMKYTAGANEHKVSVRLLAGVDVTDLTAMRAAANEIGDGLASVLANVCDVHHWVLEDSTRVELFSEPFSPVKNGSLAYGAVVASDSATLSVPGRGQPAIGLAQGNTRFEFFPGVLVAVTWANKTYDGSGVPAFVSFVALLVASTVYWADIYGSKASASIVFDTQINAHWQKKFGL